jgi:hypothetical protein
LVLFNHPTNVPRIEYDADGNRKGLLIEEARTNLTLTSENFAANYNLSRTGVSVSHGGVADPAGGTSASTFTYSGSSASEGIFDDLASGVGNTTYTFSIWLKSATLSQARLLLKNASSDSVKAQAVVNLSSEWQRFDVTGTTDGASAGARIEFTTNGVAGSMDIWGAQLEAGSFPTSYISTSGAPASRSADVASIPTSAFGYNQKAGTVVAEMNHPLANRAGSRKYVWNIKDSGNDRLSVRASDGVNSILEPRGVVGNGVSTTDFVSPVTTAASYKVALSYNDVNATMSVNGVLAAQSTAYAGNPQTTLALAQSGTGGSQPNGHIKSIQYYPRRSVTPSYRS